MEYDLDTADKLLYLDAWRRRYRPATVYERAIDNSPLRIYVEAKVREYIAKRDAI